MNNEPSFIKLFFVLLSFLCFLIPTYGQDLNKPRIYLSRNDEFFTGRNTPVIGELVVVDPLTLQEINSIKFDNFSAQNVEITEDRSIAYILGQSNPDDTVNGVSVNAIIAYDLINNRTIKRAYDGRYASSVKIGPDGLIYVLLYNEQSLEINDPNLNVITRIPLGDFTKDIVFDNGKGFISLQTSLAIVDLQSRNVISKFTIPNGFNFYGFGNDDLAVGTDHMLYISRGTSIIKLDTGSNTIVTRFNELDEAYNIVVSPDNKTLYRLPPAKQSTGTVYVINAQTGITEPPVIVNKKGSFIYTLRIDKNRKDLLYVGDPISLYVEDLTTKELLSRTFYATIDRNGISPIIGGFALAGNFAIGVPPNISFTDVKEGDVVQKGSLFNVTWQPTIGKDSFIPVSYTVSLIQGLSKQPLTGDDPTKPAKNLAGDINSFLWRVPVQAGTAQLEIVVTDAGARSGTQLINITIGDKPAGDSQAPSVSFVSPLGSESFTVGDSLNINWTSSDNVGVVRQDLSLSTDGGNTFPITITTGLRGEVQSFNFTLPDNAVTTNGRLKLVVSDAAGNAAQTMTKDFTIKTKPDNQAPVVTISTPNGQTFLAGQPINVNWQTIDNGTVMSQAISLSLDGGANFTKIKALGATDNSFNLSGLVALTQTTSKAVVQITASDSNGNVGLAMASFSIAPVITMASYSKKVLDVSGLGFFANGSNASYQLMVNGKTVSSFAFSGSNTSFSFKGNKKKLGIVKGSNTVQLLVNGQSSNSRGFNF